jgi:AraC-like DNA-binding protein
VTIATPQPPRPGLTPGRRWVTDLQIGEVAAKLGLGSPFHFSRMFKQRYGESPQSFRARMRDGS